MQTQARPPSAQSLQSHAALPPSIPRKEVQGLIPRLTTAINDIDAFKAQLGSGAQDGSLPNWDLLLSRYSLLLARISALSKSISQLPPPPSLRPGAPKPASASIPTLSRYLVHPLHPLPVPGSSSSAEPINPLANDTFFQAINTQLLPSVSESQADLLSSEASGGTGGIGPGQPWIPLEELKKMSERDLDALILRLRGRLERESGMTERMKDAVKRYEEQVEWGMRIEDDAVGGEGEDEDDLFGDEGGEKPPAKADAKAAPNPREGWTMVDYLKYMETGTLPTHAGIPSRPQPDVIDLT